MNRFLRFNVFTIILIIIICGCEKNEMQPEPEIKPDNELLELAYDMNYKYPIGFYHEKNLVGSRYYENTVSVKPLSEREHVWIELHTTNKEEAKTWSNLSNEYSSVNRILIQENENEKYFEFVRVNEVRETDVLLSRTHRSNYFIPTFDKFTKIFLFGEHEKNIEFGVYKGNATLDNVKEFIEYLWDCYSLNILGEKVIVSKIYEQNDRFEHHIQSLRMVGGDWGLHDMIYVHNNIFSLDKKTNTLILADRKQIQEIQGKFHERW